MSRKIYSYTAAEFLAAIEPTGGYINATDIASLTGVNLEEWLQDEQQIELLAYLDCKHEISVEQCVQRRGNHVWMLPVLANRLACDGNVCWAVLVNLAISKAMDGESYPGSRERLQSDLQCVMDGIPLRR